MFLREGKVLEINGITRGIVPDLSCTGLRDGDWSGVGEDTPPESLTNPVNSTEEI